MPGKGKAKRELKSGEAMLSNRVTTPRPNQSAFAKSFRMPQPYEPADPRAQYVVQSLNEHGRSSFAAATAGEALAKAKKLQADGQAVQIFSVGQGLVTIAHLMEAAAANGG